MSLGLAGGLRDDLRDDFPVNPILCAFSKSSLFIFFSKQYLNQPLLYTTSSISEPPN